MKSETTMVLPCWTSIVNVSDMADGLTQTCVVDVDDSERKHWAHIGWSEGGVRASCTNIPLACRRAPRLLEERNIRKIHATQDHPRLTVLEQYINHDYFFRFCLPLIPFQDTFSRPNCCWKHPYTNTFCGLPREQRRRAKWRRCFGRFRYSNCT